MASGEGNLNACNCQSCTGGSTGGMPLIRIFYPRLKGSLCLLKSVSRLRFVAARKVSYLRAYEKPIGKQLSGFFPKVWKS